MGPPRCAVRPAQRHIVLQLAAGHIVLRQGEQSIVLRPGAHTMVLPPHGPTTRAPRSQPVWLLAPPPRRLIDRRLTMRLPWLSSPPAVITLTALADRPFGVVSDATDPVGEPGADRYRIPSITSNR